MKKKIGCKHNKERIISYPHYEEKLKIGDGILLLCPKGCKPISINIVSQYPYEERGNMNG